MLHCSSCAIAASHNLTPQSVCGASNAVSFVGVQADSLRGSVRMLQASSCAVMVRITLCMQTRDTGANASAECGDCAVQASRQHFMAQPFVVAWHFMAQPFLAAWHSLFLLCAGRQAERANAYAAMRRGEPVQLSKDAINQLDQTSLTQRPGHAQEHGQEHAQEQRSEQVNRDSSESSSDDGFEIYYPESDSRHRTSGHAGKTSGKGQKRSAGDTPTVAVNPRP